MCILFFKIKGHYTDFPGKVLGKYTMFFLRVDCIELRTLRICTAGKVLLPLTNLYMGVTTCASYLHLLLLMDMYVTHKVCLPGKVRTWV